MIIDWFQIQPYPQFIPEHRVRSGIVVQNVDPILPPATITMDSWFQVQPYPIEFIPEHQTRPGLFTQNIDPILPPVPVPEMDSWFHIQPYPIEFIPEHQTRPGMWVSHTAPVPPVGQLVFTVAPSPGDVLQVDYIRDS